MLGPRRADEGHSRPSKRESHVLRRGDDLRPLLFRRVDHLRIGLSLGLRRRHKEIIRFGHAKRQLHRAELLIYEAARAQIVDEVIRPALGRGAVVLCDRFYDSTVAYQGCGRGLDGAFIDAANRFACDGVVPDATVLLVAPASAVRSRMGRREGTDRLELAGDAFHSRVAVGFEQIAEADPARVRTVLSRVHRADTFRAVLEAVSPVLPEAAAALAGGADLDALVTREMAAKRAEKEAKAKEGARG